MTPHMLADDIAVSFNSATERTYWRASVVGARGIPAVAFKSRSSMIELTYYVNDGRFAVSFAKTSCSFGDFMSATHKALRTVLTALKACGHATPAPLDDLDGELRIQYNPRLKVSYVSLACLDDDWMEEPKPFKADAPLL